ncbi:glycosyltransferase [Aidingimonas lacisalsi]|uniref:glycosyltransferase n=1 Tax=Aidingimonas lacisalsi TaxID=2604086 RepID=UPI0011D2B90D|nr:glycosyltransferase [Aidingimonas lacisalsi]
MISIITPVYNGGKYIRDCIESVLDQDEVDVEHIIVDDGSTDSTPSIISEYKSVVLLSQRRHGANAARNKGLNIARGSYVKFLDSDDMLVRGALKKQYYYSLGVLGKKISYGYYESFRDNGLIEKKMRSSAVKLNNNVADLIMRNILISLPLYPLETLKAVGGFDERMHAKQEWALNIKLSSIGYSFEFDDTLIFRQRLHDASHRISNRKISPALELKNLEYAFEAVANSNEKIIFDAWALYLWREGGGLIKNGDHEGGRMFYKKAKEISPNGYKSFLNTKYKIVMAIVGEVAATRLWHYKEQLNSSLLIKKVNNI